MIFYLCVVIFYLFLKNEGSKQWNVLRVVSVEEYFLYVGACSNVLHGSIFFCLVLGQPLFSGTAKFFFLFDESFVLVPTFVLGQFTSSADVRPRQTTDGKCHPSIFYGLYCIHVD